MEKHKIFISSVQKEFKEERIALRDFITRDPLCRRYFDVFLFEEPQFEQRGGQFVLTIRRKKATQQRTPAQVEAQEAQVSAQVAAQVIAFCHEPRTAKEIMAELGLRHWKTFQTNYLMPLLGAEYLRKHGKRK